MSEQHPMPPGWDLSEPGHALTAFLNSLPARPQLLALGEPAHSMDSFPAWRNRLFRALVEDHGFRSVAIESDIVAGLRVNAYGTVGEGHLDEVMQTGFSHGFGAIPANRALVEWMREFNAGRESADRLRFYGFDAPLEFWAPSPRASLLALYAFLSARLDDLPADTAATIESLCGEEARWSNPATVMDPAQSIGGGEEVRHLRLIADDLCTLLRSQAPRLAAGPGFWEAQVQARTATGLLQYHARMADPAPSRLARLAALRDLLMADHLSAIARRERERGPTLVFAHNTHLQRPLSAMGMAGQRLEWWGVGAHMSARLGHCYAFIATNPGTAPDTGRKEPAPGTLAAALMDLAGPATLFSSRDLPALLAGSLPDPQQLLLTDGVLILKEPVN